MNIKPLTTPFFKDKAQLHSSVSIWMLIHIVYSTAMVQCTMLQWGECTTTFLIIAHSKLATLIRCSALCGREEFIPFTHRIHWMKSPHCPPSLVYTVNIMVCQFLLVCLYLTILYSLHSIRHTVSVPPQINPFCTPDLSQFWYFNDIYLFFLLILNVLLGKQQLY